jgi:hypothetical protein
MTTEIAINTVFPERINRRFEVVFNELLKVAAKHADQHRDPYVIDLISRARAIAADFDSGVK